MSYKPGIADDQPMANMARRRMSQLFRDNYKPASSTTIPGVGKKTVQNFITGKSDMTITKLQTVGDYFDVPITYFFEGCQ